METSNIPFKISVLPHGSYIIQDTRSSNKDTAYSERGIWARLDGFGGYTPTTYDPNKPGDMERLKGNLENLIKRDQEYQDTVKRNTPVGSISAEEFLGGKTEISKPRMYTESQLKIAFSYYAFSSISQQPYNEEELERDFQEFCRILNK